MINGFRKSLNPPSTTMSSRLFEFLCTFILRVLIHPFVAYQTLPECSGEHEGLIRSFKGLAWTGIAIIVMAAFLLWAMPRSMYVGLLTLLGAIYAACGVIVVTKAMQVHDDKLQRLASAGR
jgi:hypothetical protein